MQIDELVVKLVMDATGFGKGQKEAADATGKLKQSVTADAKATEAAVAKVTTGVEALGRKFLGLYALVTAGRGLREFVSDLTSTDAALGRTARNIDLGAKALSTWQNAAEASGGSAAGITGAMRGLSGELQRAALTGQSSVIPAFRAMGINLATSGGKARDVTDIFRDLNKVAQTMDPARFTALANLAGISDEGTISMLEVKTSEFNKLIKAQEKYATTSADVEAAQKRQTGWRELLITSTSIGRTILTAVTPALVSMMKAVQDWANGKDWTKLSKPISEFLETLTNADWKGFIGQAEDFATKLKDIVTAADDAAKGVNSNSLLFKGIEALGVLAGVKVLGSVLSLTAGLGKLANIPVTGMLARILMNPVLAGSLGVGALLASGDPDKIPMVGGHPDTKPQDSDLGLPGVGDRGTNDTTRPQSVWDWIKANAVPDFSGFGDRLPKSPDGVPAAPLPPERPATFAPNTDGNALRRGDEVAAGQRGGLWDSLKRLVGFGDDPKVKDSVEATAKSTAGMFDLMRNGATAGGLAGEGGVTSSSGGLGGSGQHAGGGSGRDGGGSSSPGASLRDRGHGGHGFGHGEGAADPNLPVGNVPGASGYGAIYAYWKGALDKRGEGGHTGPKEMFNYLKSIGASDNEALMFTGAAASESSFNPNAVHDGGSGHGLFGHNDGRLNMRGKTWQEQAGLALAEGRRMFGDRITKARSPEELADLEMHYERPRGYHKNTPRSGDNYMGRLNSIRRFSALTGHPTGQAPVPVPALSGSGAVSDGEVAAARARLVAGNAQASDHALIARYLKEQNTPPPAGSAPTLHHAARAAIGAVPVEVTESSAKRIAHPMNEALRHRMMGARRAGYNHGIERAMDQSSSIAHMHRVAGFARHVAALNHTVHNVDNSSATTIGSMTVHTKAENRRELAADLEKHLARSREATQNNSGLA